MVPPVFNDNRLLSPSAMHTFSGQESYLYYYFGVYAVLLLMRAQNNSCLYYLFIWDVYVTRRHVLNALVADVIKTSYRAQCCGVSCSIRTEKLRLTFETMHFGYMVLTGCTLTQKEPFV